MGSCSGKSDQHSREMIYPGTDVFVVCYDMCSDNSLSNIQHFFQNEFKAAKDLAPVILCGCKYDNWLELTKHTDCIRRDGPIDLREVAQVTLLRCDAFFMTFLFQLNRSQRKSTLFSTFSHRLKLAMVYLEKPMNLCGTSCTTLINRLSRWKVAPIVWS